MQKPGTHSEEMEVNNVKFSLLYFDVVLLCFENKIISMCSENKIISTVSVNSFAGPLVAYQEPCMRKTRRGSW